jgi:superfamily II DNA or RNA helicase
MKRRPYQIAATRAAFREWRKGKRSTLFVCPTGGGKSWVFSDVAAGFIRRHSGRVLILAAQDWLVGQARRNIEKHTRLTVGTEMAKQRVDRAAPPQVVCGSVQSMQRRLSDFAPDCFGLIIIDEADLAMAPSYR